MKHDEYYSYINSFYKSVLHFEKSFFLPQELAFVFSKTLIYLRRITVKFYEFLIIFLSVMNE